MISKGMFQDNIFAMQRAIWRDINKCGIYASLFFVLDSILVSIANRIDDVPITPSRAKSLSATGKKLSGALRAIAEDKRGDAFGVLLTAIDDWLVLKQEFDEA